MISKISKLPIVDKDFLRSWFSDFNNILQCMPVIRNGNELLVELNSGFFKKKIKLEYYEKIDRNFFQFNFINEENTFRIYVILDDDPFFRVYYEGANEKEFEKILDEISKNIKEKLYIDYIYYKNKMENITLSDKLKSVSFVTKIVAKSKLLLEKEVFTTDLVSTIEEILSSIFQEPILYISGYGDGVFRLIFINGEFKGIYINYEGKESFTEDDLKNLKGKFKISVYSTTFGDILNEN